MYEGQLIVYQIRPLLNIPLEWETEIARVDKPYYFMDVQKRGPYKIWRHEHFFAPLEKGVKIRDKIHYELPFGFFGKLLSRKIRKDLNEIFTYRRQELEKLFGTSPSL